jgi:hypothetical protein
MTVEAYESRAAKLHEFVTSSLEDGRTVYLHTRYRVTKLSKRHLPLIRVRGNAFEIKCGKRWIDYTWIDRATAE